MGAPCPSALELERVARGEPVADAVRVHAERCEACAGALVEIRENDRFLGGARSILADAIDHQRERPPPPRDAVRGFEIVEEIGRGGQGVVYRAVQTATKRAAAIKILLAGAFASERQRHRFEREVEIAARLRHPNIVSVFASGQTTGDAPFVAMEYVDGVSIDVHAEERFAGLAREDRSRINGIAALMGEVASGVGHAHTSGVIHRDLKPSNILIDGAGRPRVLDFGLARPVEASVEVSATHEFVGTPAYASPEQLAGDPASINARSDVYALGLILYNLLTGRHPYPADGTLAELARHAIATEPSPPSRHVRRLPSDVETIVLKCLAKSPERRYASAVALASDIEDYLHGRPISARRDSAAYVLRKLAMRHRVPAAAGLLVVLTVIAATIGLALLASDLDRARRGAEAALAMSDFQRARLIGAAGNIEQAEWLLWEVFARSSRARDVGLFDAPTEDSRRAVWALAELYARLPRLLRIRAPAPVRLCGRNADGSVWATLGDGSSARWSATGELLGRSEALVDSSAFRAVGGSDSGEFIAVYDGESVSIYDSSGVLISRTPITWDVRKWTIRITDDAAWGVAFDLDTQEVRVVRLGSSDQPTVLARSATFARFQESDHGLRLVVGAMEGPTGVVTIYGMPDLKVVRRIEVPVDPMYLRLQGPRGTLLTGDESYLFLTLAENLVAIDLRTSKPTFSGFTDSRAVFGGICLDPANETLTTASNEGTIQTYSVPDLRLLSTIPATRGPVHVAADETAITYGDVEGMISVFERGDRPWLGSIPASGDTRSMIGCGSDGTAAWCDGSGQLSILRPGVRSPIVVRASEEALTGVAISPALDRILTTGFDGSVRLWSLGGERLGVVHDGEARTWGPSFSPDGAAIAFGEDRGEIRIVRDGEPTVLIETGCDRIPMTAFSRDGTRLLCATIGAGALLCDTVTGEIIHRFGEADAMVRSVAWSVDGTMCISGGDDRIIRFWDARTGRLVRMAQGLPWQPFSIAAHPAGDLLFVVGRGSEMLVLDTHAASEIARFRVHDRLTFSIVLAPDGNSALIAGQDEEIRIVDFAHLGAFIRGNRSFWNESPGPKGP